MTIRYVGIGGNDGNSGLTWALRKLTLTGAEDTPVVAGDTIYVGPGVYREQLTCDVNGSSGNPITYIGDNLGIYTDGVGGEVRVTGSNDDKVRIRSYCVLLDGNDYRTFRGFRFDMATCMYQSSAAGKSDYLVVEDCCFDTHDKYTASNGITLNLGENWNSAIIRRCVFVNAGAGIYIWNQYDINLVVENCLFAYTGYEAIKFVQDVNYVTLKNCSFIACGANNTTVGYSISSAGITAINAYNCVYASAPIRADVLGALVEDYGFYVPNYTDAGMRINVTNGANSITRNLFLLPPFLLDGFYLPQQSFDFMPGAVIKNYASGQSPPSDDLYGLPRPTADSKKTRGAIQYNAIERETTIIPSGETESIKMSDAMVHQVIVPTTGKKMNFSVEVYREADYAGTNPQLIIKQPGQSDRTQTDTGSSGQFNELSDSFTPASFPTYVILQIRSDNTATSGSYATYWGAFEVK